MQTIKVEVMWADKNYCGGWGYDGLGVVMATGKTLDEFKKEFESALSFHVHGVSEDGDDVPQWLIDKDFTIEYELKVSALLREAERYTTMAVISRESGINQKQLSHYASNVKEPREPQRRKIIDGLHKIAQSFTALC